MKTISRTSILIIFLVLSITNIFSWEFKIGGVQAKDPDSWGFGFNLGYDLFNEPIFDFGSGNKLKFMMGPSIGYNFLGYERPIFSDTGIPYNTSDSLMAEGDNGLVLTETGERTDDGETIYEASGYDESAQAKHFTTTHIIPVMWTAKIAYQTDLSGNIVGAFFRPGIGYAMNLMFTDLPDTYNDSFATDENKTKFKSSEYLSGLAWQLGGGVNFRNFFVEYQYRFIDIQNMDGDEYDLSGHEIMFGVNTKLASWKNDKTAY